MAGLIEVVRTLNSVARTVLVGSVVGVLGLTGWVAYRTHHAGTLALEQKDRELATVRSEIDTLSLKLADKDRALAERAEHIDTLQRTVNEREQQIEQLELAMSLLTVDRRVARLRVLDQRHDPRTGAVRSWLEFAELNEAGDTLGAPRQFELEGDVVFVDAWVVKFDDRFLRQADLRRGSSVVLFRRLFGEHQKPHDGMVLDEVGTRPGAYGSGRLSELERQIWDQFWSIANDPQKADELGIRAAHGEAPSIRLAPGMVYLLQLRASDGLSIIVDREASTPSAPAS